MPKNAPVSIIPSSAMLTTPLRSEKRPPSAANVSGVANRSVAASSAPHAKTESRCATLERVASTPPSDACEPGHDGAPADPPLCRLTAQMPQATATIPIRIGHSEQA